MNQVHYINQAFGFFINFKLPVGTGALLQHFVYMADGVTAAQVR